MTLLTATGTRLYTQRADSLGGVLFRNVPPGNGYRVRLDPKGPESGPLTVHTDSGVAVGPGIYNQKIPDNGYTYLTTRDGTQLAIDVHTQPAPPVYRVFPPASTSPTSAWTTSRPIPPSSNTRATGMPTRPALRTALPCWPTSWASRSSTSTCVARGARVAPTTSSSPCRTSMAMT